MCTCLGSRMHSREREKEREREREREREEIWMLRYEIGQKIEADFTFNVGYYFPLSNEYHIRAALQSR